MKLSSRFERYYTKNPLDKIPWMRIHADDLIEIVATGKVKPGFALDLGCGVGVQSIYLARRGFKTTGIDISETAIKIAKENATRAKVKVNFINADATNLSFLKNKKFDFILDLGNLHSLPKNKRRKYVAGIIKHTKQGSKFLLRCFSKCGTRKEFVRRRIGFIYFFSKKDIEKLFSKYFKILETAKVIPFLLKNPPSKKQDRYLMERL